jgi:hypothetical protein
MLYAGLDLSRKRLDFHLLDAEGETVDVGASPPDADGLRGLTQRLERHGAPIRAAIESMNGARFVHDRLELAGWQVEIADAQKVKGLAPLAPTLARTPSTVPATSKRRRGSASNAAQRRPGRPRPPPRRSDLAHAQPRPTLRSQRRHQPAGRLTVLKEMRHRSELPSALSS